jgi:hypothetical protein
MLPAIGVNKQGAIVVAWYDRRDNTENLGWKIRAATSLDGGQTFSPSVVVSEGSNMYSAKDEWILMPPSVSGGGVGRGGGGGRGGAASRPLGVRVGLNWFYIAGGHTSGMAVDAEGVFHPVWVDNRTGVPHLWTAPITVTGTVEKHGARELADLEEITDKLALEAVSTNFDRTTNTFTLSARLRNASKDTVRGPIKARVVVLRSEIGVPQVIGAENGQTGVGAIWDLSAALPAGGLAPEASGPLTTFAIRLNDLRPIQAGKSFKQGLVQFETRIYGRLSKTK